MLYYKNFGIKYDEDAKDYVLFIVPGMLFSERFSSISYAYNYIDLLYMDA